MSLIIFLIILSVLVIVHELGHFSVAKFFGIRVDEFGLGYPPKAKNLFRWKGTNFTLNWLPFGGFVKIFGENPQDTPRSDLVGQGPTLAEDNFQTKNRGIQAAVLVAGVVCNFLFAWLLISLGFVTGMPSPAGLSFPIENPQTVVTTIIPDSPAADAGIKSGDVLISIDNISFTPEAASEYISNANPPLVFKVDRGGVISEKVITPASGIVADRSAVGIAMAVVGTAKLPLHKAFWQGLKTTSELTLLTAEALGKFLSQAVVGRADLSAITGPVGLVGMVGDVEELGFSHLVIFTALISINLCLINLLPFPALDGGRLLFVGIETVTRRAIPAKIFNVLNTTGFALLIFLMILVTIRDVRNIL
ncbi:MAG: M50 family metallopeptidase [Patescibacteria group bacterium]